MERTIAVKKLGKLLGKSMGYRIDSKAASRDEREAARAELKLALETRSKLEEEKNQRRRVLLEADAEYQKLDAAYKEARVHVDKLSSITRHHKITVGISNSMFFHVKAEGDSWEEVIDKLQQEKSAA